MGLRDKIVKGVEQSKSLQIEFDDGFDPTQNCAIPGTRLSGHVVVYNPQPLSIGELRMTVYGISEATILRKISTIRNHFFGCGFLFHEITVLLHGPITLEPTGSGHRYPFSFMLPKSTEPMAKNNANFVNKFKMRPPFSGAQEMHALPQTFGVTRSCFLVIIKAQWSII